MIPQETLLVTLVKLVDRLPLPPKAPLTKPGRTRVYSERLFLKALVIMIVRHLYKVGELLAVLHEPTAEMQTLRGLLTEDAKLPSERTFYRRLAALPDSLPAQIGCLGRHRVACIQPWTHCGRAVALDSSVLRVSGGVWHKKDRQAGNVPHTRIDTEAHWTKSGWHGWFYGWKLHLVCTVADVWIPLAADLTAANVADNEHAPHLLLELPLEALFVLGDVHYNTPELDAHCTCRGPARLLPDFDGMSILLAGFLGWLLNRKAKISEQFRQVGLIIEDAELVFYQLLHPSPRPEVAQKPKASAPSCRRATRYCLCSAGKRGVAPGAGWFFKASRPPSLAAL